MGGWANLYVGIAVDIPTRLKQHIAEAKDSCLSLTKNPNLGLFLATFLNGCAGTARMLEANRDNPTLSRFFYRTPEAYMAARENYCDVTTTLFGSIADGWFINGWRKRNC